jgi:hypothetical protein
MNQLKKLAIFAVILLSFSCKKDNDDETVTPTPVAPVYKLILKYKFDNTQARLNNIGQPTGIPAGHGAQSPVFRKMSSHYIELAQGDFTPLGGGKVLYRAPETTAGGNNAIDFSQSTLAADGETFFSVPLSDAVGTYKWLRVSLAYQNYDINFRWSNFDLTGTVASFIGFNTYITSFAPNHHTITVNDDMLQGYWAFEMDTFGIDTVFTGQSAGTTVPNPLSATSPIPAGSCVVTGPFASPLTITGNETHDIVVIVSLSTNNSFEWTDAANDNIYEPPADVVVDMGVRGLIPIVQ